MFSNDAKLHGGGEQAGEQIKKLNCSNEYSKIRQWCNSSAIVESL